jgi:glutamate-1-semialdehyde aminotransferase
VGPQSVASLLERKALVFGGATLTASDVAVAAGMATMGTHPVTSLDPNLVAAAVAKIREMVEDVVDQMKVRECSISKCSDSVSS